MEQGMKMKIKFINIALFVLLTNIFVLETANAGLIVGSLYSDGTTQWEYVGSFDVADGPYHRNATPYNGIAAAILIFGELPSNSTYALSSKKIENYEDLSQFIVNHMAWYDTHNFITGISEFSEYAIANNAGTNFYDATHDISAFINDRAVAGEYINHVFKSAATSVPEPSTIAILASILIGLSAFRLKKSN
jgi:hypothetical protein